MSKFTAQFASLVLLIVAAHAAPAQTAVNGTPSGGQPQELQLPADARPGFTFVNRTGGLICDFVLTITSGNSRFRGAVLDDPNPHADPVTPNEDWDVDDDADGTLDGGESDTLGDVENPGGDALAAPDNSLPEPKSSIRIEEIGMNNCVGMDRNFSITLLFDPAPARGDKITLQPTNQRGANMYAWVGPLDREQRFAMATGGQLAPTFAATGRQPGVLVSALRVGVATPGQSLARLLTEPEGEVDLAAGVVRFPRPVDGGAGITVEGALTGFGVVTVAATLAGEEGGFPGWGVPVLSALGVLVLVLLALRFLRRRP